MGELITLDVKLRAFVRKEKKNRWVSICPRLGVASQGTSAEDAKHALQDAVELWFESCVERGVLDQAMRESGFRPLPSGQEPPPDSERVMVASYEVETESDILGDEFNVHFEIPAYQAAHFVGALA